MNADKLGPANWRRWKTFTASLCGLAMAWGVGQHLHHRSTAVRPSHATQATPPASTKVLTASDAGPRLNAPPADTEAVPSQRPFQTTSSSPRPQRAAADIPSEESGKNAHIPCNSRPRVAEADSSTASLEDALARGMSPSNGDAVQPGRERLEDRADDRQLSTEDDRAQPATAVANDSGAKAEVADVTAVPPPTPHEFYADEPVGRAHVAATEAGNPTQEPDNEAAGRARITDQPADVTQASTEAGVDSKEAAGAAQEATGPAAEKTAESEPTAPHIDADSEFKPINRIGLRIRPPVEVDQEGKPQPLPPDTVTEEFRRKGTIDYRGLTVGSWYDNESLAPDFPFCFRPLRFEDPNLERCGITRSEFLQPAISAGHFFGSVALLPGKMLLLNGCACVSPFPDCPPCSAYSLKDNFLGLEFDWLPSWP